MGAMRDRIKMRLTVIKWVASNWIREKWQFTRERR